jgi:hypothetical protein
MMNDRHGTKILRKKNIVSTETEYGGNLNKFIGKKLKLLSPKD